MPSRSRRRASARLRSLAGRAAAALRRAWRALRADDVPIQVLLVDARRRRAVGRDLRAGLRRIRRAIGRPLPEGLAVVVQETLDADCPLPGRHHRCDGTGAAPLALVRLALRVDGRPVGRDALLAALADQVLALALPTEEPARPLAVEAAPPPIDPLLPHPNGHGPRLDRAAA